MSSKSHTPRDKSCLLCEQAFLAEWARLAKNGAWHTSELCPSCEAHLREKAA